MYFLSIGDSIVDAFRTVMYVLCELIYSLMVFFFKVFQALGRAQILDETITKTLFGRISLIIGIFMTFRLTFAFIQYIINPDTLADKKKGAGNIIVKIVVAVVLLGSSNYIFQFAYKVQDKIISSAIIEKIIFGVAQDTEDFGQNLSAETFTVFYRLNPDIDIDSDPGGTAGRCIAYVQENENQYGRNSSKLRDDIINANGNLGQTDIYKCLGERAKIKNSNDTAWVIQFDGGGIMAVLIGCAVSYLIIMFTVQVGVRIIQLAYLQIIAPIPIMMYITTSGEDKLKKYFDQCITTFLDFFIRTAIIYFAIYAIDMLNSGNVVENIFAVAKFGNNIFETGYIKIVMIIAILTFAKKVPNLIKEIFPSLGGAAGFSYNLSPKKMIDDTLGNGAILRRGFGAAAVGFGAIQKNARKGIGKLWDNLANPDNKITPGMSEERKKEIRAERAKLIGRATFGAALSGFGGVRRGLTTTTSSQRKAAVTNTVEATQAKQKLHDEGYGSSLAGLFTEKGQQGFKKQAGDAVRGFFGRDQIIGDMTTLSDSALAGLQEQLSEARRKNPTGNHVLIASKTNPNMYMITDSAGNVKENGSGGTYFTEAEARAQFMADGKDYDSASDIARLEKELGKTTGKNKALHQKENEQSKKKNG